LPLAATELEKAFRQTKEALEAEKRKALFVMEKEQKNIKQLQQERNSLKTQLQQLAQQLVEREQVWSPPFACGFLSPSATLAHTLPPSPPVCACVRVCVLEQFAGADGTVYSSRDEEVKRLREEMREKQEALDTMKKDLETYARMQRLIDQSGDSSDPAQVRHLFLSRTLSIQPDFED
jgi:DNA repair exonuclease SbcCD ATPase subunit